jgi:acetyl-CoA acetyltransferase
MEKTNMVASVCVVGVGMTPFAKPGAHEPYPAMAAAAVRDALTDAGLVYADMQQAYVGYVYGDSTAGQCALYGVGMSGIPVINVNNNCSTGSTALFLARQAVAQRRCRLCAGARFRAHEPRCAGRSVQRPPVAV